MGGLPPLPLELRRGVRTAPDPAGALAGWSCSEHIAIAVPDLTRTLPLETALNAVARCAPDRQVIVGLGLHRTMTKDELSPLQRWSPVQHNPDDCVPTMTVMGVPGAVHRLVYEADWCLSIGVCELHQYAGLSGGHKGVSIGCGSRETIASMHHRDRIIQDGVEVGRVVGNPFREAIDLLGRAAGCHLALNWIPALQLWMAGSPERILHEAIRRLQPWTPVARPAAGARLHIPPSKAKSLYQASRAATYLALSPRPPLEPGAVLALEARCDEGLGTEEGFCRAIEAHPPPWSSLLTGPAPSGAGAQRAVMIALLAQRYQLRVYGCATAHELRRCGIWASPEPAPCEPDWLDIHTPFERLPQLTVGS